MIEKLKPCPFCGAEPGTEWHDAGIDDNDVERTIERIACKNEECGVSVFTNFIDSEERDKIISEWNTRHGEQPAKNEGI